MQRSTKAVLGAFLAFSLCGCAEMHRGFEAIAQSTSPAPAVTPVTLASDDSEMDEPEPVVERARALPSPKEIFDFHPAGSRPDTMRQAFIIDPNDGPLAADVRRTATELKTFLTTIHSDTKTAERTSCTAIDSRLVDGRCVKLSQRSAVVVSRDPLALR